MCHEVGRCRGTQAICGQIQDCYVGGVAYAAIQHQAFGVAQDQQSSQHGVDAGNLGHGTTIEH